MDQIKSNLKAVVGSSKNGIPLCDLEAEYKRFTSSSINYRNYNYLDFMSFLRSMPDLIRLSYFDNRWLVSLITTDSDPQCLKKLCNLIQNTKIKKTNKNHNHHNNQHNIPQNILAKAANYDQVAMPIPDHRNSNIINNNNHNYNQLSKRNNSNNNNRYKTNTKPNTNNGVPINTNYFLDNYNKISTPNTDNVSSNQLTLSKGFCNGQTIRTRVTSPIINEQDNSIINNNNYTASITNPPSLVTNSTPIMSNNKVISFNTDNLIISPIKSTSISNGCDSKSDPNTNSILWPLNFEICVDVLFKQVKILGIQNGYALVTLFELMKSGEYIKTNTFTDIYPGNFCLWQPPISNVHRQTNCIDITNVIPVIVLNRFSNDVIAIRVMGLKMILQVLAKDLYEYPRDISLINKLRIECQTRQLTFVRLAMVNNFLNDWNNLTLDNLYFAPVYINEKEYVFERCDKRGDFLNVMINIQFTMHHLNELIPEQQKYFIEYLVDQIELCKKALIPSYKNMISSKDLNKFTDCNILIEVYDDTDCQDQMFIGSEQILSSTDLITKELKLDRITFIASSNTFHFFDKHLTEVSVHRSFPLFGLYLLNDKFVNSRLSEVSSLRFHASMLLHIMQYSKLYNLVMPYK